MTEKTSTNGNICIFQVRIAETMVIIFLYIFALDLFRMTLAEEHFKVNITCDVAGILKSFMIIRPNYVLYDGKVSKDKLSVSYKCPKKPRIIEKYLKPFETALQLANCKSQRLCSPLTDVGERQRMITNMKYIITYPNEKYTICQFVADCIEKDGFPEWRIHLLNQYSTSKVCSIMLLRRQHRNLKFNQKLYYQANMKKVSQKPIQKSKDKEELTTSNATLLFVGIIVQTFGYLWILFISKDVDQALVPLPSAKTDTSDLFGTTGNIEMEEEDATTSKSINVASNREE